MTTVSFSTSASSGVWEITETSASGSGNVTTSCWTVTMEHQALRLWQAENPTEPRFPTDPELEPYRERVARNA